MANAGPSPSVGRILRRVHFFSRPLDAEDARRFLYESDNLRMINNIKTRLINDLKCDLIVVRKQLKFHHFLEGADKNKSNWMWYVNCANHEELQNEIAFQFLGKIYYRTYKPVLPFTEILVWSGDDYGSELSKQIKETKCLIPQKKIIGFSCDVCNRLFSSVESLQRHLKIHPLTHHEKRHRCPECSYSTDKSSHLRDHLLTHSGEKPHSCQHCPKRFGVKSHLTKHILLHKGEKEFLCSTCGVRFYLKGDLMRRREALPLPRLREGLQGSISSAESSVCTPVKGPTPAYIANGGSLSQVISPCTSAAYTRECFTQLLFLRKGIPSTGRTKEARR